MRKVDQYREAVQRLSEALAVDKNNPLAIDGSIQRFEFCFELAWKAIQESLRGEGFEVQSPRQAFEQAYAMNWIQDEKLWLNILQDRNLTSHTYDEHLAHRIYSHLKRYQAAFAGLYKHLENPDDATSL